MKENEIRPQDLFEEYLRLSAEYAASMNQDNFQDVDCPGCGASGGAFRFEKSGFRYCRCPECNSLYCSPRPSAIELDRFYKESEASAYWAKVFSPAVAEVRREKLFRSKALRVQEYMNQTDVAPLSVCDAGAGNGVFLEELARVFPSANLAAIEVNKEGARLCRNRGFETLQRSVEESAEWTGRFDLTVSLEVIEHVHSPLEFVRSMRRLLGAQGVCIATGLGGEGFDILMLQQRSRSVSPPHHLNFLSVRGFERLFERAGFSTAQVITPGELDLDIVANSGGGGEFVQVLCSRGEQAQRDFQEMLQRLRMSSHVWIVAKAC